MHIREWLSKNIVPVTMALVLVNLVVIYWSTINWGLYNSRLLLGRTSLSRSKTAVRQQIESTDGSLPPPVAKRAVTDSSSALRLTCADDDLASAFASVRTAVVNITAESVTTQKGGGVSAGPVALDDPAVVFAEEQSLGSGLIVDRRGYIVTNAHVVAKAQEVRVVTFGFERKAYPAGIVLKDIQNDIAVLKIQPEAPLPTALLGDSDMIKVADTVLAVGSPFGLEQTVTAGIISDDSRDLIIEGVTYEGMLQTDAAINRGNSGGPLVSMQGEVIGINTAIYAPTGVFTGVGFAIPINRVKPVVKHALAM